MNTIRSKISNSLIKIKNKKRANEEPGNRCYNTTINWVDDKSIDPNIAIKSPKLIERQNLLINIEMNRS